jgi:hypothetical protein
VADLAGKIGGALPSLGQKEFAADLGQVVLEDRDPAAITLAPEVVHDHRCRSLGVGAQQLSNLGFVGIEQRRPPLALVAGRLPELQEAVDGGAAHAQQGGDLRLGAVLSIEQPVDLGPLLHSEHSLLLGLVLTEGLSKTGCGYGNLSSFRPARSVQFSPGVDTRGTRKPRFVPEMQRAPGQLTRGT